MLDWLPHYTIKRSLRSKYISVRICQRQGLVLTIPKNLSDNKGLEFLQQKRSWIEKHLTTIHRYTEQTVLPDILDLLAINKRINIFYKFANHAKITLIEAPGQITLIGDIDNQKACLSSIKLWLMQQAKYYLPLELDQQSVRLGLSYTDVSIRQQQTRWGSCSAKKRINLNYKLLFLPIELMQYILIHELCHTVHLNHSAAFWRLVKKFCKDVRKCHMELRRFSQEMPKWL